MLISNQILNNNWRLTFWDRPATRNCDSCHTWSVFFLLSLIAHNSCYLLFLIVQSSASLSKRFGIDTRTLRRQLFKENAIIKMPMSNANVGEKNQIIQEHNREHNQTSHVNHAGRNVKRQTSNEFDFRMLEAVIYHLSSPTLWTSTEPIF